VLALDGPGMRAWSQLVNLRCDWDRAAAEVLAVYRSLVDPAASAAEDQELAS